MGINEGMDRFNKSATTKRSPTQIQQQHVSHSDQQQNIPQHKYNISFINQQ